MQTHRDQYTEEPRDKQGQVGPLPVANAVMHTPADPAWYQTWPGPGSRPSGTQKTPASQHPQNWSATWTKDSKRRDKRWVKYEGIGPVDESGMPIAPRSVSPGLGTTDGWGPGTHTEPRFYEVKWGRSRLYPNIPD